MACELREVVPSRAGSTDEATVAVSGVRRQRCPASRRCTQVIRLQPRPPTQDRLETEQRTERRRPFLAPLAS